MKRFLQEAPCPKCGVPNMRQKIVCVCGHPVWSILGYGVQTHSLVGELGLDTIFDHVVRAEDTDKIKQVYVVRIPGAKYEKYRLRRTFYVFKRQPFCAGCGVAAAKWLVVKRKSESGYNLILVTKDCVPLTIDHIVPKSKGGQNVMSNYQTMCFGCNSVKDSMADEDFKEKIASSSKFAT